MVSHRDGPEFLRSDFPVRTVNDRRERPWRRMLLPVVPWLLVPVMVAVQYVIVDDLAVDVSGENRWGLVLMFAACVPVSWAVIETMWASFDRPALQVAFVRTILLPLLMGTGLGVTAALVRLRPGVEDSIEAARRPSGWHYWYDASQGGGGIVEEMTLTVLANMFMPMLMGLGLIVFVVLPYFAFWRPERFIEANMMDTSDEAQAGNSAAARLISILLMLAFAVPTVVVLLSNNGETGQAWVVGIAMTAAGVVLMGLVLRHQTPDHEARGTLPTAFRGVQTLRHEAESAESGDDR